MPNIILNKAGEARKSNNERTISEGLGRVLWLIAGLYFCGEYRFRESTFEY